MADPVGDVAGFWGEYGESIETLTLYAVGIAAYALLVNLFYQPLSKRVMFAPAGGGNGNTFLYALAFPLVSFGFFLIVAGSLLLLGDEAQDPLTVFTLAMALVLAIRLCAYFSETTAHEMAKILPLGLLGVFLVDADLVRDHSSAFSQLLEIVDHAALVGVYFAIVVAVETVLRSVYLMASGAARAPRGPRAPRGRDPLSAARLPHERGPPR